jgi:prepilin-type N-terminal cleavage/methylation domain-containing protein
MLQRNIMQTQYASIRVFHHSRPSPDKAGDLGPIWNPYCNAGSASGGTTTPGRFLRNSGFTLIELIVVIALMGLMLFFSLPRLQNNPFLNDTKKSSRWLISKIQTLKENAIRDQKRYTLHFDLDSGSVWETNEAMSPDDIESAVLGSYALPDDLQIMDIEYPSIGKINSGQAEIVFYKAGYTNKALVHMQDGDTYLSFLIEPFLSNVQIFEKYASFED